ncbi:DNA polymerase delta catalytic subunit [Cichlidogyrus casuarinus]|uniref:DNA polymerase delta catalytic subunit n=1 Tax=Cichlidogyrus casuarinus TaxID=1844966 RepID=A0ABD2PXW9_9PLAT
MSKRPSNFKKPSHNVNSKAPKLAQKEEDDPSTFEQELMLLDEMDTEQVEMEQVTGSEGNLDDDKVSSKTWERPSLPSLDPKSDKIIFQILDVDHYKGAKVNGMPGKADTYIPISRLFGITETGNSICAHVYGFLPYFYVPAPPELTDASDLRLCLEALNAAVLKQLRAKEAEGIPNPVVGLKLQQKENIYGYNNQKKETFLQISIIIPRLVATAKRVLEQGFAFPNCSFRSFAIFEANIDFEIRFMVDTGITGCCWVELPPGQYQIRQGDDRTTRCQLETNVGVEQLKVYPSEGEWAKIAPLRILSFDIECAGRKGVFPTPDVDPVIQIANMVSLYGETRPFIRNVFTLNTCAPIIGSQV